MLQVGVVGLGNWGTALANHLANKGYQVYGWSVDPGVADSINKDHRNSLFLTDVELSKNLVATEKIEELFDKEILVLVIPSSALAEVLPKLKLKPNTILVSAIKGLVKDRLMTPLQFANENLNDVKLSVISGPSFAKDIVIGKPTGVVAASQYEEVAIRVAEIFSSSSLKVYSSNDYLGVELGGITKNVIAVAAGVSDGLNLGDSARAALVTRGLAEMTRLATKMGADPRTLSGLAGLGDLVLTATCDASRNRTVGLRLGRGESLQHIIETLGSVAEGIKTTPSVLELAKKHQVDMPIAEQVGKLIAGEVQPKEMLAALIQRSLKPEFY